VSFQSSTALMWRLPVFLTLEHSSKDYFAQKYGQNRQRSAVFVWSVREQKQSVRAMRFFARKKQAKGLTILKLAE